jgi:uncharacterized protein YukE
MNEKELKSIPVLKAIQSAKKDINGICKEMNSQIIERISEEWTGVDGRRFAEEFTEVFNIALKITDYYDEIEKYWKQYLNKDGK